MPWKEVKEEAEAKAEGTSLPTGHSLEKGRSGRPKLTGGKVLASEDRTSQGLSLSLRF